MTERLGRANQRNYTTSGLGEVYMTESEEELNKLRCGILEILKRSRYEEVVYDAEASAFTTEPCEPRTEAVMLHSWQGMLFGIPDLRDITTRQSDAVGFKVILRGNGTTQRQIIKLLDVDPSKEMENGQIINFGYALEEVRRESWNASKATPFFKN